MFKKTKISKNKLDINNLINIQKGFIKSKENSNNFLRYFVLIVLIIVGFLGYIALKEVSKIKFDLDSILSFSGFGLNLEEIEKKSTIKTTNGKTNIVIIGRGGDENDAPELTDSILIASINYKNKSISMFSVPRDLYVAYPTSGAGKINEVYFRALRKTKDEFEAIKSLNEVLGKITGEEMHYFVNLDFNGFRKIIDSVGGINIDVPNQIIDNTYPGPNHSYITFKINPGLQTLDGKTALMYARSRHSTSDFDRSLRQQLIIKALREKFLSLDLLTSPSKIKSIYAILQEHVITNLDLGQMIDLALFLKDIPKENIVSSNLNDGCFYGSYTCEKGGFLYVPLRADFGGASVMLQEGGTKSNPSNYSKLINYTNIVFNYPLVYAENLPINIFNSTKVSGLAQDVATSLKKYGFNIPDKDSIGNTSGDKYEKSKILYTTGSGEEIPQTVKALEMFIFGGSEKVEVLPKYSKNPQTKIEIIIGDDYKNLNF
ncbi:LCP family protein [Candidatus Gracilibacteria bacterium]|nr:LCP family protein [Candidatus Gracilibacteria bacterium]